MNSYYFIFEVEPQSGNPVIGHASRGVAHIWVLSASMDIARDKAISFLKSEHWELTKETKASLLTSEQIAQLEGEDLANYQTALSEGLHAKFYYWHRSE